MHLTQLSYKIHNHKISVSRNITRKECAVCHSGKQVSLCAGCKTIWYCGKEHQKEHWKEHKFGCKLNQAAQVERASHPTTLGRVSSQDKRLLIEDWADIHRKPLSEALAWAMHDCKPQYDFRKQYFQINLAYRDSSGGNPALAFDVKDVTLSNIPSPGTPTGDQMDYYLKVSVIPFHEEDRVRRGYVSVALCLYIIDNGEVAWQSGASIYESFIPKYRPLDQPFYYALQHTAKHGLVFRTIDKSKGMKVAMGLLEMHPSLTKWIFKEYTAEELINKGIPQLPA